MAPEHGSSSVVGDNESLTTEDARSVEPVSIPNRNANRENPQQRK